MHTKLRWDPQAPAPSPLFDQKLLCKPAGALTTVVKVMIRELNYISEKPPWQTGLHLAAILPEVNITKKSNTVYFEDLSLNNRDSVDLLCFRV